jgi:thioredoxin reductase
VIDAVVVGGGPAGLAAALWLARYRRSVVVVDSAEYRNRWVEQAHGYIGADPIAPGELLERARAEVLAYPTAEVRKGEVSRVKAGDSFSVVVDGSTIEARRLVLATGVVDQFPEVDNFFEHYGVDVFHCPTCEGYEAKGKRVVVFGWSEYVAGFALTMDNWASSVTVVTDGHPFEGDDHHRKVLDARGIRVIEDEAVQLTGKRGDLRSVTLRHGGETPCEMAFFSIAHLPRTDMGDALGCRRTDEGYLEVDECNETTVSGVYAAGDVTPGMQLIQVAAAKGTVAGVSCAISLLKEDGVVGTDIT